MPAYLWMAREVPAAAGGLSQVSGVKSAGFGDRSFPGAQQRSAQGLRTRQRPRMGSGPLPSGGAGRRGEVCRPGAKMLGERALRWDKIRRKREDELEEAKPGRSLHQCPPSEASSRCRACASASISRTRFTASSMRVSATCWA